MGEAQRNPSRARSTTAPPQQLSKQDGWSEAKPINNLNDEW